MRWLAAVLAVGVLCVPAWGQVISEIRIDQPGTDVEEYFEIAGTAGLSLNDLTYLVIGDSSSGPAQPAGRSGSLECVVSLAGLSIPADGFFLASENPLVGTGGLGLVGDSDLVTGTSNIMNFENGENFTHMLVRNFTGTLDQVIDTDRDGYIDIFPWSEIVDTVSLIEKPNGAGHTPPGDNYDEWDYSEDPSLSSPGIGPDLGIYVPAHVYRLPPDGTGTWNIGPFGGGQDSPGVGPTPLVQGGAEFAMKGDTGISVDLASLTSGGIAPVAIFVTTLPAVGTLSDGGTPISTNGHEVTGALTYDPPGGSTSGFTGTPSLEFKAVDAASTESTVAKFYIAVQDRGVVITEVMTIPFGSDSVYEYIEVYNYGTSGVTLGALAGDLLDGTETPEVSGNITGGSIGVGEMKIITAANTGGLDDDFRCDWGLRASDIIRVDLNTWEALVATRTLLALYDSTGGLLDALLVDQDAWGGAAPFGGGQSLTIWDSPLISFPFAPVNSDNNDNGFNWLRAGSAVGEYGGGLQVSFVQENQGNPGFIYRRNQAYTPLSGVDSCFQECCLPDPTNGCVLATQEVCEQEMCGSWQPDDGDCSSSSPNCSFTTGSCCVDFGDCRENTKCECDLAGGTFTTNGSCATAGCAAATTLEINEIDYDQTGDDTAEFIELVGPPGMDLSNWSVELYNGADNSRYENILLLDQTMPADGFFVIGAADRVPNTDLDMPAGSFGWFQNGEPDGIVLCNGTTAVEGFAYEGEMTVSIVCGGTSGLTLSDIGLRDHGGTNMGSFQKLPDGGLWAVTVKSTPGGDPPKVTTPGASNLRLTVTGACCLTLGGCNDNRTASDCGTSGALAWFPASSCGLVTCPAPLGACCTPEGQCLDLVTEAECVGTAGVCGVFHSGDTCSNGGGTVTCTPMPTVFCCTAYGDCVEVTTCGCAQLDGTVQGSDCTTGGCPAPTQVAVNEIDYDQSAADTTEFIELVGPPGTSLDGWVVELYNGNGGAQYMRIPLDTYSIPANRFFVIGTQNGPTGTPNTDLPIALTSWFQNGAPDGLVLCNGNTPVEMFSYEGTMGIADACTSGAGPYTLSDIGPGDFGQNGSIQKLPNGGTWTFTGDAMTPGESNTATPITGACCEALGGCVDAISQSGCVNAFGTWFEAQLCSNVTCPPALGACCQSDGSCEDYVSSSGCADNCFNATWTQGGLCSTVGLGCAVLPTGQCCMYIGVCIEVAECDCFDPTVGVLSGNWDGQANCNTSGCSVDGSVAINEIRIDQPGNDDDEYFELTGTPNMSLNGLTYVVLGDGTGGSGVIEAAIDLSGQVISGDGFFLVAEDNDTFGAAADMIASLDFENSDNVTHLLVAGFTGAVDDDLDTDVTTNGGDGTLDVTPWAAVVDSVALIEHDPPVGPFEEHVYSTNGVGPDCFYVPGHVFRIPDETGPWQIGLFDPTSGNDTPDATNAQPLITGVRSCRYHCDPHPGCDAPANEHCLDLTVNNIEPRLGTVQKMEFDLSDTVSSVSASVSCVNNIYVGTVTVVTPPPAGTLVTLTFDPDLPDRDCCEIELSGDVNDTFNVRTLVGDVNLDGGVSFSDAGSVEQRIGEITSSANVQYDMNADGSISAADFGSVEQRLGAVAPPCPDCP